MAEKSIENYTPEQTRQIKELALSVATILGSYIDDMVIIGGLVPTLLVEPESLSEETDLHVGTSDLDLGLDITIFDEDRYAEIAEHLRNNDFVPDTNEKGNPTRQRWVFSKPPYGKIDFLIQQTNEKEKPSSIKKLDFDFGAIVIPGIELAFKDSIPVKITGKNYWGEMVTRTINVCNPGVFVVLKTLAVKIRREPKDAYDLYYMIRNYGKGVEDVTRYLKPLAEHPVGAEAVEHLREEFATEESSGPRRVAAFLNAGDDAELMADVVGYVAELLRGID